MSVHEARIIHVSVNRDWREVYDFASVPENLQRWAAGLGGRFQQSAGEWTAEDPDGRPIRIRFSEPNAFGILDHDVSAGGRTTHNSVRVVPNGTGAEVIFVLLKHPTMTEQAFAADGAAVERDLRRLKELLESGAMFPAVPPS
jgi:hypothetical protein